MNFSITSESNCFLVPEMPTPNGRMHLGHIAGPYLKMDVLRRKIIRNGAQAWMVSGVDVFESYVELKSAQTNTSLSGICKQYHREIAEDLKALQIEMDLFVNPLEEQYLYSFVDLQIEMAAALVQNKGVKRVKEQFAFDLDIGTYLTGCWICGTCPICKWESGSYLCENCGAHYKPEDIFLLCNYPNIQIEVHETLFLKLPVQQLRKKFAEMAIPQNFVEIFEQYTAHQGEKIRLTSLQKSGIPFGGSNQVFYTYTALWFFSVYCGELARSKFNLKCNPFDLDSGLTTVASFGIDNTIPYLAGVLGAALNSNRHKAFDFFLPNFFYLLEGQKFSTSRRHVIWARDLVQKANISADVVRYYLIKNNPQFQTTNFSVQEFVDDVNNELVLPHNEIISRCTSKLKPLQASGIEAMEVHFFIQLERVLIEQNECLSLANFNLSMMTRQIDPWFQLFFQAELSASQMYWWLKAYALIVYPILPGIAQKIWEGLCREPEVKASDFFASVKLDLQQEWRLNAISLKQCENYIFKN